MRSTIITIIIILIIIGGYLFYRNRKEPISQQVPNPVKEIIPPSSDNNAGNSAKNQKIDLAAQNNSKESGSAEISAEDGKTKVVLNLSGAPSNIAQPAHIHIGTCANIGAIRYPLSFPINGKSETILDISYDQLLNQGPLAINVHKSAAEINTNYACGDISSNPNSSQGTISPTPNSNQTPGGSTKPVQNGSDRNSSSDNATNNEKSPGY